MNRKVLLLVGMLVIVAAAAFVYFDPMDLNLLGLNEEPTIAKAIAPTHPAVPVTHPTETKPVATAPTPHPAPVIAVAPVPAPLVKAMSATASKSEEPTITVPIVAPIQAPQPHMELAKTTKSSSTPAVDKPVRSKNLDLRHCLKLETDAAIAKCAGE
ncbi:MAG: hypothetical protein ABI144_05170 [Gallionella sp.]